VFGAETLPNAPIRSGLEEVRRNYSRKVMVEGKGNDHPLRPASEVREFPAVLTSSR
jgi:hypothetical protein